MLSLTRTDPPLSLQTVEEPTGVVDHSVAAKVHGQRTNFLCLFCAHSQTQILGLSFSVVVVVVIVVVVELNKYSCASGLAQRERAGLITQRSQDRNLDPLVFFLL